MPIVTSSCAGSSSVQLDAFFGGADFVQATEKASNNAVISFIFVVMP